MKDNCFIVNDKAAVVFVVIIVFVVDEAKSTISIVLYLTVFIDGNLNIIYVVIIFRFVFTTMPWEYSSLLFI